MTTRYEAVCPWCKRIIGLEHDGRLWVHGVLGGTQDLFRGARACPGSGRDPSGDGPDKEKETKTHARP